MGSVWLCLKTERRVCFALASLPCTVTRDLCGVLCCSTGLVGGLVVNVIYTHFSADIRGRYVRSHFSSQLGIKVGF